LKNFRSYIVTALTLLTTSGALAPVMAANFNSDLPPDSINIPLMAKEKSISTYVPSATAEGHGLAVNLIFTAKPRFKTGAPVAVVAPGGIGPDGLTFNMHAAQIGAVELRFAFPGGGSPEFGSKGVFDNRGTKSVEAFRDILLFAAGRKTDYKDRTIAELLAPGIKVNPSNLGIVGWDNGGNIALVAMAKYAKELGVVEGSERGKEGSLIKWLALYECPVGSMFSPPNLGSSTDLLKNKHYREGSAATGNLLIDYRNLTWLGHLFRNPNKIAGKKRGLPGMKGVLFFDENQNGIWEESLEYAFNSALDPGLTKQFFPPQLTAASQRKLVFGKEWPSNVATVAESEEFFAERDGSLYVKEITQAFPKLLVGMFASAVDHNQQQLDHPHICFLYNLFLTNKVRWLRLNPDPCYLADIGQMSGYNFVNNKPNLPLDPTGLLSHMEPEGALPDYVCMQGMVAELVDRIKVGNLVYPISQPLCPYSNGAAAAKAEAEARHKKAIEAENRQEAELNSEDDKEKLESVKPSGPAKAKPGVKPKAAALPVKKRSRH